MSVCQTCGGTGIAPVVVKVKAEEYVESPRKEMSNLGTMACWHRRHDLGDLQLKTDDPLEWYRANVPEGSVVLPLYIYDHGGITMRTGAFVDPWDSGQVGWIFATPETIRKEYSCKRITKKIREQVENVLRCEVKTYDDFLTGNVWYFRIEGDDDTDIDSCGGFYGDDALEQMKEHVPARLHSALETAWENRGG